LMQKAWQTSLVMESVDDWDMPTRARGEVWLAQPR